MDCPLPPRDMALTPAAGQILSDADQAGACSADGGSGPPPQDFRGTDP
jgi:hypothetical protein